MNDPGAQRPGDPVPLAQRYTSADPIDWCGAAVYPMYAEALSLGTTTVRLHALSVMAPAEVTGLGLGLTVQGGYVHLNGKSLQGVDIWYDALADGVDIVVTADAPEALFTLTPVWVAGSQAQQSWTGNYGMVIDLLPGSTSTLWCSTGPGTPDFNELVVELATAPAPNLAPFAPPSLWTEDAAIQEAVPHTPFAPVTMPPTPAISAAMLADPLLSAALRAVGPDSGRPATSTGSRPAPSGFVPPAVQNPSAPPLSAADRADATAGPTGTLPGRRIPAADHGDTTPAGPTGARPGAPLPAPVPGDVASTERGTGYSGDSGPFADQTGTATGSAAAASAGGPGPATSRISGPQAEPTSAVPAQGFATSDFGAASTGPVGGAENSAESPNGATAGGHTSVAPGHGFAPNATGATAGGGTGTRGPIEKQVRAASDGLSGADAQVPGSGRREFSDLWTAPNADTVDEVSVDGHQPRVSAAALPALPTRVPASAASGEPVAAAPTGVPAGSPVPVIPTDASVRTADHASALARPAAEQVSNAGQLPTRRVASAGHASTEAQAPNAGQLPARQVTTAGHASAEALAPNRAEHPTRRVASSEQAPNEPLAPNPAELPTRRVASAEQDSAEAQAPNAGQLPTRQVSTAGRASAEPLAPNRAELPTRRVASAEQAPNEPLAPNRAELPTRRVASAEQAPNATQAPNAAQLPTRRVSTAGRDSVDGQAPDARQAPTAERLPTRRISSVQQVPADGHSSAGGQVPADGHSSAGGQVPADGHSSADGHGSAGGRAAVAGSFGDRPSAAEHAGARFVSPEFRAPMSDTSAIPGRGAASTNDAAASDPSPLVSESSTPPPAVVSASDDSHGGTQSDPVVGGVPATPSAPSVMSAAGRPHPVSSAAAGPERPATITPLGRGTQGLPSADSRMPEQPAIDSRAPGQGPIAPVVPAIPPDSPAEPNPPASALRAPQASGGQGFGRALYDLGTAMHERGEHDSARMLLTQAAEAGHSAAAYDLGVLLLRAGDRAGAEHWWKAAAHDDPRAAASLTELPR
ncbi:tetratricopeptide repeat protein [Nocardia asteroides]|uniref:tetratricopeptide repeat protein n=1 Tax=Nocardia asteroides TaxID=1824 RepID=UPI0033E91779